MAKGQWNIKLKIKTTFANLTKAIWGKTKKKLNKVINDNSHKHQVAYFGMQR